MPKIFKYELACLEEQTIQLPQDAQIIRVASVEGKFFLWAIVDPELPLEGRCLVCYKTGQPFKQNPNHLSYLGLCSLWIMQELGLYFFEDFGATYALKVANGLVEEVVTE